MVAQGVLVYQMQGEQALNALMGDETYLALPGEVSHYLGLKTGIRVQEHGLPIRHFTKFISVFLHIPSSTGSKTTFISPAHPFMAVNFLIVGRTPGTSPPTHDNTYAPNTNEYTFVASAIGIALRMMETSHAQAAMTDLALLFDGTRRAGSLFQGSRPTAAMWVSWFVGRVKAAYPKVVVDESMDSDTLAEHTRMEWTGQLEEFSPRDQFVALNANVRISLCRSVKKTKAL